MCSGRHIFHTAQRCAITIKISDGGLFLSLLGERFSKGEQKKNVFIFRLMHVEFAARLPSLAYAPLADSSCLLKALGRFGEPGQM